MHPQLRSVLWVAALAGALAACNRGQDAAAPAVAPTPAEAVPPVAAPAVAAGQVTDVLETSASMVVGITYPKGLEAYPGLVKVLTDYAQQRRDELKREVDALGNDQPEIAYDLTLSFQKLAESPDLVAVAADGDLYTGGSHGQPLVMRYVWLPKQNKLLTAGELVPTAAGWAAVSAYAREQLKVAAQERIAEDQALTPEEVARLLTSDSRSIDEGAAAKAENFEQFEPLLDTKQKIRVLRFVFPPYQIGPYAYGVQSVDVPADVLRPHVAAAYQDLFAP